jgi:hypothetical protein
VVSALLFEAASERAELGLGLRVTVDADLGYAERLAGHTSFLGGLTKRAVVTLAYRVIQNGETDPPETTMSRLSPSAEAWDSHACGGLRNFLH